MDNTEFDNLVHRLKTLEREFNEKQEYINNEMCKLKESQKKLFQIYENEINPLYDKLQSLTLNHEKIETIEGSVSYESRVSYVIHKEDEAIDFLESQGLLEFLNIKKETEEHSIIWNVEINKQKLAEAIQLQDDKVLLNGINIYFVEVLTENYIVIKYN